MNRDQFMAALTNDLDEKRKHQRHGPVQKNGSATSMHRIVNTNDTSEDISMRVNALLNSDSTASNNDSKHAVDAEIGYDELKKRIGHDYNFLIKQLHEFQSTNLTVHHDDTEKSLQNILEFIELLGVTHFRNTTELRIFISNSFDVTVRELWRQIAPRIKSTTKSNGATESTKYQTSSGLILQHKASRSVPVANTNIQNLGKGSSNAPLTVQNSNAQEDYDRIAHEERQFPSFIDTKKIHEVPLNIEFVRDNIALCKMLKFIELRIIEQLSQNRYAHSISVNFDVMLGGFNMWQRVCALFNDNEQYRAQLATVRNGDGIDMQVLMIEWDLNAQR